MDYIDTCIGRLFRGTQVQLRDGSVHTIKEISITDCYPDRFKMQLSGHFESVPYTWYNNEQKDALAFIRSNTYCYDIMGTVDIRGRMITTLPSLSDCPYTPVCNSTQAVSADDILLLL